MNLSFNDSQPPYHVAAASSESPPTAMPLGELHSALLLAYTSPVIGVALSVAGLAVGLYDRIPGPWSEVAYRATDLLSAICFYVGVMAAGVCIVGGTPIHRILGALPAIIYFLMLVRHFSLLLV
jgi:hypothetical protein